MDRMSETQRVIVSLFSVLFKEGASLHHYDVTSKSMGAVDLHVHKVDSFKIILSQSYGELVNRGFGVLDLAKRDFPISGR